MFGSFREVVQLSSVLSSNHVASPVFEGILTSSLASLLYITLFALYL